MISTLILPLIGRFLNRYLQCDTEMQGRLAKYHHRVIRITVTPFDWTFYCKIENQSIVLLGDYEGPIDAGLKAGITALARSAFAEKFYVSPDIEMQGDVALIEAITTLFKSVEIDWEGYLATYSGDTIAHGASLLVQNVKAFHTRLAETERLNIKEYLQEEINILPHPYAVEDFCKDVDDIRHAVERLDARLSLMEAYAED